MVGRVTPNSAAICATVWRRLPSAPVSPYISWAMRAWRRVSLGFCPPVRPRVRAAASPSLVRSLEQLLEAEVEAWIERARAADAAEDALSGGDDSPPPGGGRPGGPKRTAQKLPRRKAARAKLEAGERARREQAEAERQDKIARLAGDKEHRERRAAEEQAKAGARVADYQRLAAAKAAVGSRKRPRGKPPTAPDQQHAVRVARQAAARAAGKLAEAIAAPAVPQAPARPPKANVTDPASRVMPIKKGGYDQLYALQAVAGRRQVILTIGTTTTPATSPPCTRWCRPAQRTWPPPGSLPQSGEPCSTPGTPARTTSPPPASRAVHRHHPRIPPGRPAARRQGPAQQPARLAGDDRPARHPRRPGRLQAAQGDHRARLRPAVRRFDRTLNYRDDMVATELHLWAAIHNMLKAIGARARRERQAAAKPVLAAA
jgi:hypothetical protein